MDAVNGCVELSCEREVNNSSLNAIHNSSGRKTKRAWCLLEMLMFMIRSVGQSSWLVVSFLKRAGSYSSILPRNTWYTGCSLNIVFLPNILGYSELWSFSVFPWCLCVYTHQAGRTPALQQNWQSSEKLQKFQEKTQYLMNTLYIKNKDSPTLPSTECNVIDDIQGISDFLLSIRCLLQFPQSTRPFDNVDRYQLYQRSNAWNN